MHERETSRAETREPLVRSAGYALLAELLERGPTGELVTVARASPRLEAAISSGATGEELEVEHETAFGREAPPCAGVFVSRFVQAGDDAGQLAAGYAELGFAAGQEGPGLDHLSTILRALAHAGGREYAGVQSRASTGAWLDRHLLHWLPVWVCTVRRLELAWPSALAEQVLELALWHRAALGGTVAPVVDLEPLPDLNLVETDMRAIASALATPCVSGMFLSRADIRRVARACETPTGFGGRRLMLENLLQSAIHLEILPRAADALRDLYRGAADALDRLAADRETFELAELVRPWSTRARETAALVEHMGAAAREACA